MLPSTAKRRVVSKDGCSVYIEVFRSTFKDVGKLGSEETGAHEFHFRTAEGFGMKFDLANTGIDERLLREVVRTSIEKWLGQAPEIREASKVTHIMHGTWQVPENGTGRTLLGPEQFLNRMADAIAASEIGNSDTRLVRDAGEAIRRWQRLGMSPNLGIFKELRQKTAAMTEAVDQKSPELTALASSELEECLLKTLNRLRQKAEADGFLSEARNHLRELNLEIERTLDGPGESSPISNRYAKEVEQFSSKMTEILAGDDAAESTSQVSALLLLISRMKSDSVIISQVREPIRNARRLERETKDDALERLTARSAELGRSALRVEGALRNGDLVEAVSAREEMTRLCESVEKELKALEEARKTLPGVVKFLAELEKKPGNLGLEEDPRDGLKRAISNLERALAAGEAAIISSNLALLNQYVRSIEVAEEREKKREVERVDQMKPRILAQYDAVGKKSMLGDSRRCVLRLTSKANEARNVTVTRADGANQTGAVSLGPFDIKAGGSLEVLIASKALVEDFELKLSCTDAEGRAYYGKLIAKPSERPTELQLWTFKV